MAGVWAGLRRTHCACEGGQVRVRRTHRALFARVWPSRACQERRRGSRRSELSEIVTSRRGPWDRHSRCREKVAPKICARVACRARFAADPRQISLDAAQIAKRCPTTTPPSPSGSPSTGAEGRLAARLPRSRARPSRSRARGRGRRGGRQEGEGEVEGEGAAVVVAAAHARAEGAARHAAARDRRPVARPLGRLWDHRAPERERRRLGPRGDARPEGEGVGRRRRPVQHDVRPRDRRREGADRDRLHRLCAAAGDGLPLLLPPSPPPPPPPTPPLTSSIPSLCSRRARRSWTWRR